MRVSVIAEMNVHGECPQAGISVLCEQALEVGLVLQHFHSGR
jgi:hypothetical protein